jgi:hypothetical protein
MYRHLTAILLFILLSGLAHGQKTIVGKILSKTTNEPIPYANIGFVNSNVGTISNYDGSFSILIPERLYKDTLTFTSLGFLKEVLAAKTLESKKKYTVYLNEKAIILNSVVITAKRIKEKLIKLGNISFDQGNYEPDTIYAGRAVSLLIDGKSFKGELTFPVIVKKATLYIFLNNFESFMFRIRLNKYDSLTGRPGVDLIDKNIILESSIRNGWIDFDLSKLNFKAEGPFFVTFEQLIDQDGRAAIAKGFREIVRWHPDWIQDGTVDIEGNEGLIKKILKGGNYLPGTFIGTTNSILALKKYSCFERQTSLAKWIKMPYVIAATVCVTPKLVVTPNESNEAQVVETQ